MVRPKRTEINLRSLSRIGIPKRFQELNVEDLYDFDNQQRKIQIDEIKEYIENLSVPFNKGIGMLLLGSNGTGKTTIASVLVKEAFIQRYSTKMLTFVEYMNLYTSLWNEKDVFNRGIIQEELDRVKSLEFLVLEEIGKHIDSKISAPILEDLLRYRENKGLPTIICTNLEVESIETMFGASVLSLLKGNCRAYRLVGDDHREGRVD